MISLDPPPAPIVTVTGRGLVRVPPDRIVFDLELEALAPTAAETQHRLADLRSRLSAALVAADVPRERVRAAHAQLRPRHDHENSRWVFKGVAGTEHLSARIPWAPGRTSEVLNALAAELEHVRVTIDHLARDTTAARAEALRAAVADAHAQATVLASASGCALGPVRSLIHKPDDRWDRRAAGTIAELAAAAPAAEFNPAVITVEAEVEAVWSLQPVSPSTTGHPQD